MRVLNRFQNWNVEDALLSASLIDIVIDIDAEEVGRDLNIIEDLEVRESGKFNGQCALEAAAKVHF